MTESAKRETPTTDGKLPPAAAGVESGEATGIGGEPGGAVAGTPGRRTHLQKLAHELKTPISAIAAAAEIMRDERLGPMGNERYLQYAADIHESARLMLDVIDRMLSHRGLEPAQQQMAFTVVDVGQLMAAVASSLRPIAERHEISLTATIPARLAHVVADATTLRQILNNILGNALKFTPREGEVRLAAEALADGGLRIEISDTGRGMSSDEIAQALAGVTAGPAGGVRDGGGLGIGLPLVKALTAANGASLAITSETGRGTRVSIVFPKDRVVPV